MNAVDACDASLVDAMKVMAEWQETAKVSLVSDVLLVTGKSRFPTPYSNAAFPLSPTVPADALLAATSEAFRDRRYMIWARGQSAANLDPIATARGFLSLGRSPAMVVEKPLETPPLPADLTVHRAEDEATFADFIRVSQLAYAEAGLPEPIAASLLARPERAMETADIFVARTRGRPVAGAIAITNPENGVSGLYWVGTVPAARRKGAADAVTRAATNAGFARGASVVTLQASEAGEPVYLRMGYREVGRYTRYLSPKVG